MRFGLLRQRVERAEQRVALRLEEARAQRAHFGMVWRRNWSPVRIVVAGALSGFLVGRAEPLSRLGGMRVLQVLGTVSSLMASLRAAGAAEAAGGAAQEAAQEADAAAEATQETVAAQQAATGAAAREVRAPVRGVRDDPLRPPSPAEAATEMSER